MKACLKSLFIAALLAGFINLGSAATDPLDDWTWRLPTPNGNTLNAITYGDNLFVAVGDAGTVVTSPDGIVWNTRLGVIQGPFRLIAYGTGKFVAVGEEGTDARPVMLTSQDGQTWVKRSAPAKRQLAKIIFANGMFVTPLSGGGTNGSILISSDGVSWTEHSTGSAGELSSIGFGNGLFVAVGTSGGIFTSTDAIAWTRRQSYNLGGGGDIVYGFDRYMTFAANINANTPNRALISTDGVNWTTAGSVWNGRGLAFGGGQFVALGNGISSTTNGTSFIGRQAPLTISTKPRSVTYGGEQFVVVGVGGQIITSPDAMNWTLRTQQFEGELTAMATGNGTLVALGAAGTSGFALTSTDGIAWSRHELAFSPAEPSAITFGNGIFVTVSSKGAIQTSPDGQVWNSGDRIGTNALELNLAFGNRLFVLTGLRGDNLENLTGLVWTSSDGINWTRRSYPRNQILTSLNFAGGKFFAHGFPLGPPVSSTNGLDWKPIDLPGGVFNLPVTYGNGTFVASSYSSLGEALSIWVSADGDQWTDTFNRFEGSYWEFKSLFFVGGIFVGAGVTSSTDGTESALLATSRDGRSWTQRYPTVGGSLKSVVFAHGSLLALAGESPAVGILQSGSLPPAAPFVRLPPASLTRAADGVVRMRLDAPLGTKLQLEGSVDLLNWSLLVEATINASPQEIADPDASRFSQRFYRAVER